jgi:hypothetical protein
MLSRLPRATTLPAALVLLALAPARPARASDLKTPYKFEIVLHVARHKLLTPVFRDQIKRELGDGMRAALGDLAKEVKVVTKHKRLPDVLKRGLGRALDDWKERTGVKTHFVLIDYRGVYYEVQTRQHDGITGLSTGLNIPVVRRDRTRDRAFVTRVAGLLIARDLGLVGTITSNPEAGRRVNVELRGGGLGVPLDRWVKVGDVFGLVRGNAALALPWRYLQVEKAPAKGVCVCRLFSRYRLSQVVGLRCVHLGTSTAPLKLRFMQENADRSLTKLEGAVSLQVRRFGFEDKPVASLPTTADSVRDYDTTRFGADGRFKNLAFVTVLSGETVRARIPIPVLDRLIVVPVPAGSEGDDLLASGLSNLRIGVADARQVQAAQFKRINTLTAKGEDRAKTIAEVRAALARSREDHSRLSKERDELRKEIKALPENKRPSLASIDASLKELENGQVALREHINHLVKIDKEENTPQKKKWLAEVERARLLEKQLEYDKAIEIYEKIVEEGFTSKDVKDHLAKIKKDWKPKSEKHKEARDFIYRKWPALTTASLKEGIEKANNAFKECREAGDRIGPRKLLLGAEAHRDRLLLELDKLDPVNGEDLKPIERIKELIPALKKLDEDLRDYLDKPKGG